MKMKKLMAILLCLVMTLSMAACGSDVEQEVGETDDQTAQSQSTENGEEATPPPPVDGDVISMTMFDITSFEPWEQNTEYDSDGEGYSNTTFFVKNDDDSERIGLDIYVESSDADDYRDELKNAGVDLYDMVENGAGEYATVSGIDCLMVEYEDWGDLQMSYIGRDQASGTNITITVTGEFDDEIVDQLISSIVLKITDQGLVDPPWFWQGEPILSTQIMTAQAGSFTLNANQLPIDAPIEAGDIFSGRIAKGADSSVWIGLDGKLYMAELGEGLTNFKEIDLEGHSFSEMSSDNAGNIYLSDFGSQLVKVDPQGTITAYGSSDYITMHPSGEWGLGYFVGRSVSKVTISGDSATVQEDFIPADETYTVSNVTITQDYIFLHGSLVDSGTHKVRVLDLQGNLLYTLGGDDLIENDDFLGSTTTFVQTSNGFMALDGNMRNIVFWDLSGNFISSLDQDVLLSAGYPWLSDADILADGSIIVCFTDERDDMSGVELIIYSLSGF